MVTVYNNSGFNPLYRLILSGTSLVRSTSENCGMAPLFVVLVSVLLFSSACATSPIAKTPPTWSPSYSVSGVLRLPYAEIVEPFQAWFDSQHGKSRIDYYAGTVAT